MNTTNDYRLIIEPALSDRGMPGFQGVVIDRAADEVFRGECHVDEEAAFHDAQRERDDLLDAIAEAARKRKFCMHESDEAKLDHTRRCAEARHYIGSGY